MTNNNINPKSILITGCSGFVGSNLLDQIEGYNILGLDKKIKLNKKYLIDLSSNDAPQKLISLFLKEKIDYVIHLAASKQDYGISTNEYFKNNVIATNNLLEFLRTKKIIYFLHISSVAIFEGEKIEGLSLFSG